MFLPVSSVNSARMPTPGALSLTSAEACVPTLMKVLTSNEPPPQVPASPGCWRRMCIEGGVDDDVVLGPTAGGDAVEVPTADAPMTAAAHVRASAPDQAASVTAPIRK